ncbi:MAG: hypothetical protein HKN81_12460 [Gammaproteobacteria bacterium]|nr:hypothetical protein [Gammaproteobacteria bacterium]
MQWRLGSARPETRIKASRDAVSVRSEDQKLLDELSVRMRTDESLEVRRAAAGSIGGIGAQRPLNAAAVDALGELVMTAEDDALLSAAIEAVGTSAANSRHPDRVVARIAAILDEQHLDWLYRRAALSLGKIGAAQPLPADVVASMNALFVAPLRRGEREYLAEAFVETSRGRGLPEATLIVLADAFEQETNRRIRIAIIYALAHSAGRYTPATDLVAAAASDADVDVARAAQHGLRVIEADRNFAGKDPLAVALDRSRPSAVRVQALQILRSSTVDPAACERIVSLSHDVDPEVAIAAFGMFQHLAPGPGDEFDEQVRFPALNQGMRAADPLIRRAAYGALSTMSVHRPAYLRAADFPALLEAGARDPDARVRVLVLVAMLRDADGTAERDAVIERGLNDSDPIVRGNVVSWLGSPKTRTGSRQALIERALQDPDPDVRAAATAARGDYESRKRAWPIELWQLLRDGEFGRLGMTILVGVTVATPILIGVVFLLYFMSRLLTYLYERRPKSLAVVGVIGAWLAASYGIFMLFFVAALAGNRGADEIAIVAGVLWAAIAAYGALGWGLHYWVRR